MIAPKPDSNCTIDIGDDEIIQEDWKWWAGRWIAVDQSVGWRRDDFNMIVFQKKRLHILKPEYFKLNEYKATT